MKAFLGDRLTITLKAPTENTNTLTIRNGTDQVLCVGWFDRDNPRIIYYETGEWERELEDTPAARVRGAE